MTLAIVSTKNPTNDGDLIPKFFEFNLKNTQRMARVLGAAQAAALVTTTTNDSGVVLELNNAAVGEQKIELLDDHFYEVLIRCLSRSDNDTYYQEVVQVVQGKHTTGDPVLASDPRIVDGFGLVAGARKKYGRAKYSAAVASGAVTEDAHSASGVTLADFSSGSGVLTVPPNRIVKATGANFAAATYGATTGAVPHVEVTDGSTAGTVELASPDDGLLDANPADGRFSMDLEIWPPVAVTLGVNGTPAIGQLQLSVLGIASDTLRHNIQVFIREGISGLAITGSED